MRLRILFPLLIVVVCLFGMQSLAAQAPDPRSVVLAGDRFEPLNAGNQGTYTEFCPQNSV